MVSLKLLYTMKLRPRRLRGSSCIRAFQNASKPSGYSAVEVSAYSSIKELSRSLRLNDVKRTLNAFRIMTHKKKYYYYDHTDTVHGITTDQEMMHRVDANDSRSRWFEFDSVTAVILPFSYVHSVLLSKTIPKHTNCNGGIFKTRDVELVSINDFLKHYKVSSHSGKHLNFSDVLFSSEMSSGPVVTAGIDLSMVQLVAGRIPVISILGHFNHGKSTLINNLQLLSIQHPVRRGEEPHGVEYNSNGIKSIGGDYKHVVTQVMNILL